MSHVFPTPFQSSLSHRCAGDGCYLIDATGKRYFDGSGGAAVSCLGHSNERVKQAIRDQLEVLEFAHTGFFTSEPAEQLADLLIANAPGDLDRAYFVSGGSEAIEASIKLARQYFVEKDEPQRRHLIARRQSYHGNTLGALAAGGNAWRQAQFSPLLIEVSHIAPCYEYAERGEAESIADYGQRTANELEEEIQRLGPENVMAFLAEPVVGATLGAVPAVDGYYTRIREICDTHGVLLILDEVMCGMGRTGHLFACEAEGIAPDILTIAKGLGAGYQPIGAMLCTGHIYDTIANGSAFSSTGIPMWATPVAAAAALAVVTEMLERDLMTQVKTRGAYFENRLRETFGQNPHIGDVRGRGLFWGVEIVADRATKRPFAGRHGVAGRVKKAAMAEGLICYPMPGTRDGKIGDHVLLAPPFIASEADLDGAVAMLDRAIASVLADTPVEV